MDSPTEKLTLEYLLECKRKHEIKLDNDRRRAHAYYYRHYERALESRRQTYYRRRDAKRALKNKIVRDTDTQDVALLMA